MEHNSDNIETQIKLLPSLLKVLTMFKMRLWYDNENFEENVMNNIVIRCRNYGKTNVLVVKNTHYKDMVTNFLLNSVLHHVGLSWIIEKNQQLEFDIYKT